MENQFLLKDTFEGFKDIPDNSVDMVLTDIPYLISKKNNFSTMGRKGIDFGEWDKEFDVDKYITECLRILKPGRSIVVFSAWQQLNQIHEIIQREFGKKAGSPRIGVWEKTNPAVFNMKIMPINPFEFFIWNRKGKKWVFNNQRGTKEGKKGETITIPERLSYKHPVVVGGHRTAKPVAIFEDLIKTFTDEGQTVFDGCAGGGTTAISAIRTGRKFLCFENSEENYQIAKDYFQKYKIENYQRYFK